MVIYYYSHLRDLFEVAVCDIKVWCHQVLFSVKSVYNDDVDWVKQWQIYAQS